MVNISKEQVSTYHVGDSEKALGREQEDQSPVISQQVDDEPENTKQDHARGSYSAISGKF